MQKSDTGIKYATNLTQPREYNIKSALPAIDLSTPINSWKKHLIYKL